MFISTTTIPGSLSPSGREYMIDAANLARTGIKAAYGGPPRYTYAVGTSNGGYQVRRAVELAAEALRRRRRLGGDVCRRGGAQHPHGSSARCSELPRLPASAYDPNSTAAKNIRGAGYPPDIVNNAVIPHRSGAAINAAYWEVDDVPVAEASRSDVQHIRQRTFDDTTTSGGCRSRTLVRTWRHSRPPG